MLPTSLMVFPTSLTMFLTLSDSASYFLDDFLISLTTLPTSSNKGSFNKGSYFVDDTSTPFDEDASTPFDNAPTPFDYASYLLDATLLMNLPTSLTNLPTWLKKLPSLLSR